MDRETIDYIIRYFSKLMTKDESLALNHHMYTLKSSESVHMRNLMIERGWINSDPEVIQLLEHGYQTFEQNVVTRIMAETPEKVFFSTIVLNATNSPVLHMLSNADIVDITGII